MIERVSLAAIVCFGLCLGAIAKAHHSFTASYLMDQRITVEGELVAFLYRNPHAYVHLEASEPDGKKVRWALEWGGVPTLANDGVNRDTLKPGDRVIAVGEPSRKAGEPRMRLRRLTRPADGWEWSGDFE